MKDGIAGSRDILVGRKDGSIVRSINNPFYCSLRSRDNRSEREEYYAEKLEELEGEIDRVIPDSLLCP